MLIIGDFDITIDNPYLDNLMQLYKITTLINTLTCYQSHNSTCIDHFLTNHKALFKLSELFETVLSDHNDLISTFMKSRSIKGPTRKRKNIGHTEILFQKFLILTSKTKRKT